MKLATNREWNLRIVADKTRVVLEVVAFKVDQTLQYATQCTVTHCGRLSSLYKLSKIPNKRRNIFGHLLLLLYKDER